MPARVDATMPPDLPLRVDAPMPPDGPLSESAPPTDNVRRMGAQLPAEAEAERIALQQTRRVYDPQLGVERLVRLSGEILEEGVSSQEARQIAHAKARHVQGPARAAAPPMQPHGHSRAPPETYTGRSKFPSQHPWHGYK
jgi:hypothetical protein